MSHLVRIICTRQSQVPFGVETATGGKEFETIVFAQFRSDGVHRDGDGAAVGFKL